MAIKLSQILRELAKVPSQASSRVAARIHKEIQANFDRGIDPYGKPWAPLALATLRKGRFPPPLTDSGDGRRNVKVSPTRSAGIEVSSTVFYMDYHRTKKRANLPKLPRRSFLPEDGLPESWRKIWEDELNYLADKRFLNKKLNV